MELPESVMQQNNSTNAQETFSVHKAWLLATVKTNA